MEERNVPKVVVQVDSMVVTDVESVWGRIDQPRAVTRVAAEQLEPTASIACPQGNIKE